MKYSLCDILTLLKIKNNDLSNFLHIDKSLVSKWINKKRKLYADSPYIDRIIYYILLNNSDNILEGYFNCSTDELKEKLILALTSTPEKNFTFRGFMSSFKKYVYEDSNYYKTTLDDFYNYIKTNDSDNIYIYDSSFLFRFEQDAPKVLLKILEFLRDSKKQLTLIVPNGFYDQRFYNFVFTYHSIITRPNIKLYFTDLTLEGFESIIAVSNEVYINFFTNKADVIQVEGNSSYFDNIINNFILHSISFQNNQFANSYKLINQTKVYKNVSDLISIMPYFSLYMLDMNTFKKIIANERYSSELENKCLMLHDCINNSILSNKYIINLESIRMALKQDYVEFNELSFFYNKTLYIPRDEYVKLIYEILEKIKNNAFDLYLVVGDGTEILFEMSSIIAKNIGMYFNDRSDLSYYLSTDNLNITQGFYDLLTFVCIKNPCIVHDNNTIYNLILNEIKDID